MSDAFDLIVLALILVAVVASAVALYALMGVKRRLRYVEADLAVLKQQGGHLGVDDLADLYTHGPDVEARVVAEMTRTQRAEVAV